MSKYIETTKIGNTPTSIVLSEGNAAVHFSWNMALPENDPLRQGMVAENPEHRKRSDALAAVKKRGSKG